MADKENLGSDLQGLTRIVGEATLGITNLVETVHNRVVHPPHLPSSPIQRIITGIAGITYKSVKLGTKAVSKSLDVLLTPLAAKLDEVGVRKDREVIRSVLNGVVGDYLEQRENPLKITMQFRKEGKAVRLDAESLSRSYPKANGKILLVVHGLCMNDLQWRRKGHHHGEELAISLGKTLASLHYNTGRHISSNGQEFDAKLEQLLANWPVPVEELVIVAHSMGGLVTRSALHYGSQKDRKWISHLKKVIFLGTPHHGASLERLGNNVDTILEAVPYAQPFARLGKIRSAGITDLRHGSILDKDWRDKDRFDPQQDSREVVPLPKNIKCYSIAGALGKATDAVSTQLLGDSLVSVESAFGKHKDPKKDIGFEEENTWIAYQTSHLDLLSSSEVYEKVRGYILL
ncbi:MAG: alpha/beta hydrolase [Bacteroidota bacterium]